MSYTVYVQTVNEDPDDDVILEDVLEGEYETKGLALVAAQEVSDREMTVTTVFDTGRVSTITGRDLLIALYEHGRRA